MIRKKKLDVVRGGIAIPIPNKDNYYYMSGRKHINGGIDLGRDPRTGLEVEDGEVVKIGKNDVKVFSSVPFQNGKSPAERVLGGENASTVFKEQEAFKDRNGLNDDGTKKKKLGGNIMGLYNNDVEEKRDATYITPYKEKPILIDKTPRGEYERRKKETRSPIGEQPLNNVSPEFYIFTGLRGLTNLMPKKVDYIPSINDSEFSVIAKKGDKIIGKIGGNITKKGYSVNNIEVVPNMRRKHIGTNLYENANKLAKNNNSSLISNKYQHQFTAVDANGKRFAPATKVWDNMVRNGKAIKYADGITPMYKMKKYGGAIVGLYSITSNGETRLRPFPSTGSFTQIRRKAALGTSNDDDETYTVRPEYKRLYDKFNVKGLNRKFDKDYFRLLDKLKANESLTVADIYNGGEGTEDAKLREILGANSTYKDIFDTDKENKLYDYYTSTYPEMNFVESGTQTNKTDMSTTNNKPGKTTTLKEIVITPKNVEDDAEKRIAKNEKRNRLVNSYLSGYHGDAVNLLSNIGGNIATALINRRMLNKMQAPPQPMSQTAAKLKTNYNINPQLDNLRETAAKYEQAVNNNTASSRTALARNQQNRFATALNTNTLYGTKENEETKLINTDRLNQQEVANKNVEAYNAWQDKVNTFKNAINEKKAENLVGLTQGITSGITSTIENVQQRMRDDKTILANALSHPNLPIEEFYHNGLISKRAYNAYRKAYPLKTDTNKED